jgi:hypothetical protein
MFLCIKCAPKAAQWLFNLAMGISYGPCESCHTRSECIDWHGNLDDADTGNKPEPLDTYRYDGL